jgi:hypothetical protein
MKDVMGDCGDRSNYNYSKAVLCMGFDSITVCHAPHLPYNMLGSVSIRFAMCTFLVVLEW